MPKGYIVARIEVSDPEGFKAFGPLAAAAIEAHGGRVLVRDPEPEIREGALPGISVVVEFDDVEHARRFYESAEYTRARETREKASVTDLRIVQGA